MFISHLLSPLLPRSGSTESRIFPQWQTWSGSLSSPWVSERFHGPEGREKAGSTGPSVGPSVPVWLEALFLPWCLIDLIMEDAVSKTPRWYVWCENFTGKRPEFSSSKISNFKHLLYDYLFNVCFKSLPFKFKYICFKKATWHQNHKWKTSITSHK